MRRGGPEVYRGPSENTYVIPRGNADLVVAAYRSGLTSIDPDGTKYPRVFQFLTEIPDDQEALLRELEAVREELPAMKFALTIRGKVMSHIFVELPLPSFSGIAAVVISKAEQQWMRDDAKNNPPISVAEKYKQALDKNIELLRRQATENSNQ